MIKLTPIKKVTNAGGILYELLQERPAEANISHHHMPSMEEHLAFVGKHPYLVWYIIENEAGRPVGSIYLTKQREIGIFIFKGHHRKGYAGEAVIALMIRWPGKLLANIAPGNTASIAFFQRLGARHIQSTYQL